MRELPRELRHERNSGLGSFLTGTRHSGVETPFSNKLIRLNKLPKSFYVAVALELLKKIRTNTWRFTVMISVIGLLSDPLLLYMPGINEAEVCIQFDKIFGIAACILLTVFDFHYILLKLHDGLREGRRRYVILLFQVASILPISQVTVMIMIIQREGSMTVHVTLWAALYFSLLLKHMRRFFPVLKWSRKAITSGKLADWSLLFFFYNLYFSQLYGAFWYLLAIYRQWECWNEACSHNHECISHLFTCSQKYSVTKIESLCNIRKHNYGIALEALQYGFLNADVFPLMKVFYCFRQGLQNLSSFGQNLEVGTDLLGNIYAILVIVFGILSFSFLIGMIQIYQQSFVERIVAKEKKEKKLEKKKEKKEKKLEKKKEKKLMKFQETEKKLREKLQEKEQWLNEAEQWLSSQNISEDLRSQINKYKHDNWHEMKTVNLENMLNNLPRDLRCKLTHELCLKMLKKVAEFARWSEASLEELCNYVKPVLYVERTRLIREGDPIDEIIFVVQGNLWTYTSTGKTTGSSRTDHLNYNHINVHMERGDFFGEELVNWIHADPYTTDLPISTKTIQAVTNGEALVLMAYDLKNIFIKHHEAAVVSVQLLWRSRRLSRSRSNTQTPSDELIEHHPHNLWQ